jgi:hypothetical protein
MLAASVLGLELHGIAGLVKTPFDKVKLPPVTLPLNVIVCTALVVAVPVVVVATAMLVPVPVRLLTAVMVGRGPKFWNVTVAVVTPRLVLAVTVTGSSVALIVPELVPMETLVMVP